MGEIFVKDKSVVVPGEVLASGIDYLPAGGAIRENDNIIAMNIGLAYITNRIIKIVPLSGRYIPKKGDIVIGKVVDITFGGWRIDIGWAFEANLNLKDATNDFIDKKADLSQYYDLGDIVAGQITHVSGSKIIDLTTKGPGLKKLKGGRVIDVTPSKVPRIIGKQGSMISLIKEKTNCRITVGQNGKVWICGENNEKEALAFEVIKKIERESHIDGLTDRISNYLEGKNEV